MKQGTFLLSVAVLYLLTRKQNRIGRIYQEVPQIFECNDGTFSTSAGNRGCSRHGGKKDGKPLSFGGSALIQIQDIPLADIHTDTKLFQGREKSFSERSVQNIVEDVAGGSFIWENLDPVTLWQSPRGKYYLLSGHSRKEAFARLAKMGLSVRGKGFTRIPAKIIVGMPLEVAQRVALESNTLSTKEKDTERAAYYRKLRQDGTPEKIILEQVKRNEGRNWTNVYAYTVLSPTGKMWETLRQFSDSEDTSAMLTKSMAKWIGQARRAHPQLTAAHENEIFDWLFNAKGYGTGSNQVASERDFLTKIDYFVQKNTFLGQFNPELPLNILNTLVKSPAEQEFDRQITELQLDIQRQDQEIKQKTKTLTAQRATKNDLARVLAPLETSLRNNRSELARLMLKRSEVIEYSKNEARLFGLRR